MTAPVVGLTDAFGTPFDSNQIDAIEGTIYPLVLDVTDPDHPSAHFFDSDFDITGPDADLFYIVDYQLIFQNEPDYENPIDSDADNLYAITVAVTDTDGETTNQDIYINIFDDPNDNNNGEEAQPPQFVSDPVAVVPENIDDVVYTAAVDNSGPGNGEDVTFAIVDGPDASLFSIDPVTGEVFFNQSPDFENPADAGGDNVYDITIEAFNQQSGDSSQLDVAITVTDENDEAPLLAPDAAVTVPENYNDVVYVAEATDADAGSSVTYAITGGADMDKLSINEHTGEVSFNQPPDFDLPVDSDGDNTYEIEIIATDDAGNESQIQSVTVTVEDLSDETPVITSTEHTAEILENAFDAVYTIEASDADASDTATFRFADDSPDAGFFMIDEFSGAIYLNLPLDHENAQDEDGDNVYELAIIASDGVNDSEALTLSITVTNENDNVPVMNGDVAEVVVPENVDDAIYTAAAADDDGDPLQYALGGADAHLFSLDPNTGELSFLAPPDFEHPLDDGGDNIYDVEITASDADYTSDALAITIEVTDETESGAPPVITSAASVSVAENTTGTVYTALADDPDSPNVTFFISGGADAGLFIIDATTGEMSFSDSPDYEAPADTDANNVYEVEITASDGVTDSSPLTISISVLAENDNVPVMAEDVAELSVRENKDGTLYTAVAADADANGDPLQFILGGADAILFDLDPHTGRLSFIAPPNFEAPHDQGGDNIYDVEISATDGFHTSDATVLSITVNNAIEGTPGPDTLVGTDGDDILDGGLGADTMIGRLGDDTYVVDNIGDAVTEHADEGIDTVETTLTFYALDTNVENLTYIGTDFFLGFANEADNIINAASATNSVLLQGLGGADELIGGAGNDVLYFDSLDTLVQGGAGVDTALVFFTETAGVNLDLAGAGVEVAYGGDGNDVLDGSGASSAVVLIGLGGADQLIGGAGNDVIYFDSLDTSLQGGDGVDAAAVFFTETDAVSLSLASTGIELAYGGVGNDVLDGSGTNSGVTLVGLGGDDQLIGGAGNDVLYFDSLDTSVQGGDGVDSAAVFFTENAAVSLDLTATGIEVAYGGVNNDVLTAAGKTESTHIEGLGGNDTLTGGLADDAIFGGEGNDIIFASAGNDYLQGDAGTDIVNYAGNQEDFTVTDIGGGFFQVTGGGIGLQNLYHIEVLHFNNGDLFL